jgi:hypothetical protein
MSYRKLFLLIAFAPLGLLLLIRDAQGWDEFPDDTTWGFIDWGDGSRVRCTLGFDDTTIQAVPGVNGTLTIMISLKAGKTLTCKKIEDNGFTQTGQAILVQGIKSTQPGDLVVTGVQDLGCSNLPGGVSQKIFQATCGQNSADVTGTILWVVPSDKGLLGSWYQFGGAASLTNSGACNQFFPRVAGTFDRNVIFTNTEGFNAPLCPLGEGNHGPTLFRGCSATGLNIPSACTDAIHTGGTPAKQPLRQITEFGLTCRTPFNTTSCSSDPSGVIQAEIDCTTIDCGQIIQSSLDCGEPDNPFKVQALDVRENQGNLVVKCPRCFNSAFVPSAAGELVVAGQLSDGTGAKSFSQDVGGICTGTPTSQ